MPSPPADAAAPPQPVGWAARWRQVLPVSEGQLLPAVSWVLGLSLLLIWVAVALSLHAQREAAEAAEVRQNTNLARVFAEQVNSLLNTLNQATLRARDEVLAGHGSAPDLARYANETGFAPRVLVQLSFVDAQGRLVASNLDAGASAGMDLSDRLHVRVHLPAAQRGDLPGLADPDGLYIGAPVLGKVSGRWTIQLSRRVTGRDGRFMGVIVASLDPAYVERLFQRVQLGSQAAVTLVGADRVVRARVSGGLPSGMGGVFAKGGTFDRLAHGAQGSFLSLSTLDGVERFTAFCWLDDYPQALLVSTATEEALAESHRRRDLMLALTLLLSVVVVAAARGLAAGLRRLERSREALRRSQLEAEAANQAKSEFLAAISHELRTPLTSIQGFAELMELKLQDERFKGPAALIRKGAEHLTALLTEILDLSKVESGALELRAEPVELPALIQGTVDFFALSAQNKGLILGSRIAPEVPRLWQCDGLRLKQILNNLLANAIKFTEQGEVRLLLSVDARGWLQVQVEDTGPGIAFDAQERIFEKFRQGHARISHDHGGTGLGLALSRGLAELMGGTLGVRSVPGEGACFTLLLPPQAA